EQHSPPEGDASCRRQGAVARDARAVPDREDAVVERLEPRARADEDVVADRDARLSEQADRRLQDAVRAERGEGAAHGEREALRAQANSQAVAAGRRPTYRALHPC